MAFGRTWLYHETAPTGQAFTDETKFNEALANGWVEAPWLVGEKTEEVEKDQPLKPWQKAQAARKAKREQETRKPQASTEE